MQVPAPAVEPAADATGVTAVTEVASVPQADAPPTETVVEPTDTDLPAEETPAQARASERALDLAAREDLQRALAWTGHYQSAIDGDFGPGTRRAMAGWQRDRGHEETGILTTTQRDDLLQGYAADLEELGLQQVLREDAGISVALPMRVVSFSKLDAPFVHFAAQAPSTARILLISQPGDTDTLKALYEVLQTLAIIPKDANARLNRRSFTIDGHHGAGTVHAQAQVTDAAVKGFIVVWPDDAPADAASIIRAMRDSFEVHEGSVLSADAGDPSAQHIDLMAGLELRRPMASWSGVYIDRSGRVLTADNGLGECGSLTLGGETPVHITALDAALALALLTPDEPLAPVDWARFKPEPARITSEIAVAGFPFGGRLGAPTLTFGKIADIQGLTGDTSLDRLALKASPGDAGGPVIDARGAVLGLLHPTDSETGQRLPDGVRFSTDSPSILHALSATGLEFSESDSIDALAPEELAALASDITVLVNCWD
jgi:peptidoglycan hydrolase-like protein with peptidoglycan-binding domain